MNRTLALWPFMAAMAVIVAASNILVQYPFQYFGLAEVLTWGAFTYPVAFLVNDLSNRRFGPRAARRVVCIGFALAVVLSIWFASPRIAIASGSAFLMAQLFDAAVFDRLRHAAWWRAPLISTLAGSALDTTFFFSLAFAASFSALDTALGFADASLSILVILPGTDIQIPLWVSLAFGDFAVKVTIGLIMLVPYRAFFGLLRPAVVRV